MKVDVGGVSDFEDGVMNIVTVEGREIGVVQWQGSFHALRNSCPHMGARLCLGPITPLLTHGADGDIAVDPDEPVLNCPWHRWEFHLKTGHAVLGGYRVKTYQVVVEDDRVFIEVWRRRKAKATAEED